MQKHAETFGFYWLHKALEPQTPWDVDSFDSTEPMLPKCAVC